MRGMERECMENNRYNWQHPMWPNFEYDISACQDMLYAYIKETTFLSGAIHHLSQQTMSDAMIDIMVLEAINTSAIEGEILDQEDVRSSIRCNLGLVHAKQVVHDRRASGVAQLMLDVRQTFKEPLTKEKLCEWHTMVMSHSEVEESEIGMWRQTHEPMQIVSGPIGHERIYFEAPPSAQVAYEMQQFIDWFNQTAPQLPQAQQPFYLCGPVRAAIAHLYFESIHPFVDGNGRIGRAIVEKALSQDLGAPVLYSVSDIILRNRKEYYKNLQINSGHSVDITRWIHFFVGLIFKAQHASQDIVRFVLQKAKFWKKYQGQVSARQEKVLLRMQKEGPLGFEGGINAKKYMSITGCSKATATRDLGDLLEKGCLYKLPGSGPITRYEIAYEGDFPWLPQAI